uniref:Alpha/beta fold hydrolase n=1 Tax=Eiseniibacteriota bacterium TaxID=2212470 RepID=A0A832I5C9_UNCEI
MSPVRLLTIAIALAALAASAPPADAQRLRSRTQWLLDEAPSPEALHARLAALADSVGPRGAADAGEAYHYIGQSWERAGALDSAIACYRRAAALRGNAEDRLALADVLLARRAPGDAVEAERLMAAGWIEAAQSGDPTGAHFRARQGWALHVLGKPVEAAERLAGVEARFSETPVWRERLAAAALDRGEPGRAWTLLLPLAALSRGEDPDVMRALRQAAERAGVGARLDDEVRRAIDARDRVERAVLDRIGGRPVRFAGEDGFPLGGTVLAPAGRARRGAVIVVRAPGDTILHWDSLAVALRASGRAVLLLDPRGHGRSLAPSCALPFRAWGREDELAALGATDVRAALRALARVARVDTSRYVVIGSGVSCAIAAQAAEADARVHALVLLSPDAPPTRRGALRARLARMRLPTYFQTAAEDRPSFLWVETLYQAGDAPNSRVADAPGAGLGPAAMRHAPDTVTRLLRWLDAPKPARPRPAPPPPPRRRG